ncbi:Protein CBG22702 [Caenorhabditis briggsae]|uniref:Protein CBG22702 n=2 Tax=Caenorhabditis briggsae TaxID=6238 RepID=A8Y2Z4_CAEBR|nr:Protein CBG22702 [Caenorhabditis briggsae]ULT84127.1 hypothetical protein L3Y34_013038 [Caenorhabditis briggsae]CAP39235.2 Protein CBG22702 [Caenorhabditis briggsae]
MDDQELPDIIIPNPLPMKAREDLMEKIVSVVVPHPNINANYDARMIELKEYVKYLEKKAFERAHSRDEYYAMLARLMYRMQKLLEMRPRRADSNDPYGDIPLSHELADFMGLTQEELEEFDEEQNPQGPSAADEAIAKSTITPKLRRTVVDKLGSMLFPPPDPFAYLEGRMDSITRKLEKIEAKAYKECDDRDEYYNMVSLRAYRLQKEYKKSGKSYLDRIVRYPVLVIRTEVVE